ncbi:uncharacterized protein [Diadema setosum]|uniref:uncharacterized protein n=1 Tax=Diadema setosum TaxID=31175 RepID=UPI003B3B633D
MASGFTPANTSTCDECHTDVMSVETSYRLEIQKNLCAKCAIEQHDSIKGLADQVKWTCQKHTDRKAELFCITHDYPICQVCAVTSNHTDCKRDDINDVRKEREKELAELICRAKTRSEELKQSDEEIHHTFQTTNRLTMIREQVSAAAEDEKSKIIKDRDQREERINADYNEQIRKLTEMRNERLKQTRDEAEEKLRKIRDEQYSLEEQIDRVERELQASKIELMPGLEELATDIRDGCMKAENLIIKQENLMKDFRDITRQMTERLSVELSRETLDRVKEVIAEIKFKRESGLLGSLEGLGERWLRVSDICFGMGNSSTRFLGFISSNEVVIEDRNYIITRRLDNMAAAPRFILLLVFKPVCYNPLSDGGHVFGTTDGKLYLYGQQWNYEKMIKTEYLKPLIVTVDKNGLIFAAEIGGSSISVFCPNDGKCLHTIKLPKKMSMRDLKTMSTGNVVVLVDMRKCGNVICILDRSDAIKCKTYISRRAGCVNLRIAVDMTSDCVYLLQFDFERRLFVVSEVFRCGREVSRCAMEWCHDFPHPSLSFDLLPPDLFIVRNAAQFTIFKRLPLFKFCEGTVASSGEGVLG